MESRHQQRNDELPLDLKEPRHEAWKKAGPICNLRLRSWKHALDNMMEIVQLSVAPTGFSCYCIRNTRLMCVSWLYSTQQPHAYSSFELWKSAPPGGRTSASGNGGGYGLSEEYSLLVNM